MSVIAEQYQDLQDSIERLRKAQDTLEGFRELIERIEAVYVENLHITNWWGSTFNLTVGLTVKDLAAEMSEHLSVMEDFGIPLETWTSTDDPENRKRCYQAKHQKKDGSELYITLAACLADDATCRIEVIGYEEKEEMQYVGVKKTVPITQLVCA